MLSNTQYSVGQSNQSVGVSTGNCFLCTRAGVGGHLLRQSMAAGLRRRGLALPGVSERASECSIAPLSDTHCVFVFIYDPACREGRRSVYRHASLSDTHTTCMTHLTGREGCLSTHRDQCCWLLCGILFLADALKDTPNAVSHPTLPVDTPSVLAVYP
jgi:hypothetical protein